jgi:hypothetical protein
MLVTFQKVFPQKHIFNPNDANDIECFRKFLIKDGWGVMGCPFILEQPYISIPHMIQDKITKNILQV